MAGDAVLVGTMAHPRRGSRWGSTPPDPTPPRRSPEGPLVPAQASTLDAGPLLLHTGKPNPTTRIPTPSPGTGKPLAERNPKRPTKPHRVQCGLQSSSADGPYHIKETAACERPLNAGPTPMVSKTRRPSPFPKGLRENGSRETSLTPLKRPPRDVQHKRGI